MLLFFPMVMVSMPVLVVFLIVVMVFMIVAFFFVFMMMMLMRVRMRMRHASCMCVLVAVLMRKMNVEFYSFDRRLVGAADVQMIPVKFQLRQLFFQFVHIHAEVDQRADKH